MSLDTLFTVFAIAETSITDKNNTVSLEPQRGERVVFFDISDQHKAGSLLRNAWNMSGEEPLCDGIIYYVQGEQKVFCLVELKGKDIKHAVEQVIHTKNVMRKTVQCKSPQCKSGCKHIIWKAYIRPSTGVPHNDKPFRNELEKEFGKSRFAIKAVSDIGDFLRK